MMLYRCESEINLADSAPLAVGVETCNQLTFTFEVTVTSSLGGYDRGTMIVMLRALDTRRDWSCDQDVMSYQAQFVTVWVTPHPYRLG